MKLYAIKPLKWAVNGDLNSTFTVFGPIHVHLQKDSDRFVFTWTFSHSDQGRSTKTFRDAKTAKFAAEAFYQGRLKKALTSKVVN